MQLATKSIEAGEAVWFAADIGEQVDHRTGIMHPEIFTPEGLFQLRPDEKPKELSVRDRRYNWSITPTHAMALISFDKPAGANKPVKFLVENSWSERAGDKGDYHMYREWFEQNVFEIVVNKKHLSDKEREIWEGAAERLKPSDWFY